MDEEDIDLFNERTDIIKEILADLNERMDKRQWDPIEKKLLPESTQFSEESLKKQIAVSLCMSCCGEIQGMYDSIDYVLHTKNLEFINQLQIILSQYNEIYSSYGNALVKTTLEHQKISNSMQREIFLLREIQNEYLSLYDLSSENQKNLKKFLKNEVKSEKTNELIICDLIYLIDLLNRQNLRNI